MSGNEPENKYKWLGDSKNSSGRIISSYDLLNNYKYVITKEINTLSSTIGKVTYTDR